VFDDSIDFINLEALRKIKADVITKRICAILFDGAPCPTGSKSGLLKPGTRYNVWRIHPTD
jgi:hypothetical protein